MTYLASELVLLALVPPLLVWQGVLPGHPFFVLWAGALVCLVALLVDSSFDRRELWDIERGRRWLGGVVWRFVLCAGVLLGVAVLWTPERLWSLIKAYPLLWALIMVAYPILSVYPQGIVYRSFILHRYRSLLPSPAARVIVSAAAFSFMHIVLDNWLAVSLTFVGGLIFAITHLRSRSLVVSSVEHALYGCFMFTVGWGRFFYHG